MTRLRRAARGESTGSAAQAKVHRAGRRAAALRAIIGVLTVVLVVLGSTTAVQ